MRHLLLANAVVAAALVIATSAGAAPRQGTTTLTKHDRDVIRFFTHHPKLAATARGQMELWRILGHVVQQVRTMQSARVARHSLYPPHHKLWLCISRYEGSPTSVNPNGHYGMLQMHAGWGYGTSYHASDDPQYVQEWAAENAWAANHYSYSFLVGQWYAYDGASVCGTTG